METVRVNRSEVAIVAIVLVSLAIAGYFYPQMPERMASHWNAQGQVDGYTSKFWGLFLMPVISIGLSLLFMLIPRIDPLRANIDKLRKYYDEFVVVILLFLLYIYLITIAWNLGYKVDILRLLAPALGILFYFCGILIEKAKRNWFIGIRTPWTMSNETVWDKTHRVGGKLFKVVGVIAIAGVFFPDQAILLIIIPVMLVAFFTVIYSYFVYRGELQKNQESGGK